jgi:solute carrier family 25 citrate transporter 1
MVSLIANSVAKLLTAQPVYCAGPHGGASGDKSFWKGTLSGGITGGIEACITYPTEYIKTMQQLYPQWSKQGARAAVKETVSNHGIRGLYRGLSVLLVFSVPKTGVRFGSKEFYDKTFFPTPSKTATFLSGAMAGTTEALLVVTPMETLKVKLIHDRFQAVPKYSSLLNGISTIYGTQGFKGIYMGPLPTVLRQSSNQAIRFTVYGEVKAKLDEIGPNWPLTLKTALSGAIAGAASVLGNNPIDVVKTNMQGLEAHKYKSSLECFVSIYKNEGFGGYYKGAGARLSRVVLDVAITFTLVEHIRNLLDKLSP